MENAKFSTGAMKAKILCYSCDKEFDENFMHVWTRNKNKSIGGWCYTYMCKECAMLNALKGDTI